uniref:Fatty acid 2-hydroxylase n=1 Tax=Seriola dumerili TaxID=41447 RepID=A0A3B4TDS4_SERDU
MSPSTSPRLFTEWEVARHCTKESCWVLLGTRVYDVTAFLRMHPGGEALILRRSGKDVIQEMEGPPHRHSENARRWMEQYYIGELDRDSGTEEAQFSLRPQRCRNNGLQARLWFPWSKSGFPQCRQRTFTQFSDLIFICFV